MQEAAGGGAQIIRTQTQVVIDPDVDKQRDVRRSVGVTVTWPQKRNITTCHWAIRFVEMIQCNHCLHFIDLAEVKRLNFSA